MASYGLDSNPQWIKVASFTESSISIAGVEATVTCDPLQLKGGGKLYVKNCIVRVREVFDGAGTVVIKVGKATLLDRYAKAIDGKTATGDFLGSDHADVLDGGYLEAGGVIPLITITSGSGNISTWTTGKADVYLLVSAAP